MSIQKFILEKLNWTILPSGDGLGHSTNYYLETVFRRYPDRERDPSRISRILSLKPERAYTGHSEFDSYLVFLFKNCPYAVLESPWTGNAVYLLDRSQWARLSKYSKTDLLTSEHHDIRRIIHDPSGAWFRQLRKVLFS